MPNSYRVWFSPANRLGLEIFYQLSAYMDIDYEAYEGLCLKSRIATFGPFPYCNQENKRIGGFSAQNLNYAKHRPNRSLFPTHRSGIAFANINATMRTRPRPF
jgi:hypothetical protein